MPQQGRDFCGQCQRRVHNLDGMTQAQREEFFAECNGEVCVAYTVKRAPLIAGIATLSTVAGIALAQEVTVNDPPSPYCDPRGLTEIIVGGTTAGKALQWIDESEARQPNAPDLPEIAEGDWLPSDSK